MNMTPSGQGINLPHGIKGLQPYSFWQEWGLWLLIGLVIAALLWGVAFFVRRRLQSKGAAAHPPEPSWQIIRRQLESLSIPGPTASYREAQEFFYQLGFLLRSMMEVRFHFPATDLTVQELIAPMERKLPMARETQRQMIVFLKRMDLIKFADAPMEAGEAEMAYRQVMDWVRAMEPRDHSADKASKVTPSEQASTQTGDFAPAPKRGMS